MTKVGTRTQKRSPAPPFTTSTLQQEASRRLGFSPKRTMSVAQRLYEGVETGRGPGRPDHLHADRLDGDRRASPWARRARSSASATAPTYTMPKGRVYKTKSKGAQEAHESIRPTSFRRDPDSLAGVAQARGAAALPADLAARARLADGAQGARDDDDRAGRRRATSCAPRRPRSCSTASPGVYTEGRDDDAADDDEETGRLPALAEGDRTTVEDVTPTQHFTEPPPRFTEATLIKALEEHGIGRPSTYAATISTITDRGYVRVEERRLHPEPVAEIVTDLLVEHFGDYVDVAFTARMEEELDEVARGERAWVPLLRAFYGPLRDRVDEKRRELKRSDFTTEATDEVCSEGHPMVIRLGPERAVPGLLALPGAQGEPAAARATSRRPRRGPARSARSAARARSSASAAGSARSSAARATRTATTSRRTARRRPIRCRSRSTCPKNKDGHLVPRRARRTGNVFWGCSNYPRCDFTTNHEPLGGLHDTDDGPLARKDETAHLPGLRLDQRHAGRRASSRASATPGGPAEPGGARPSGARPRRRAGRRQRRKAGGRPRGGARSGGRATTRRTRPGRAGRRRVSGAPAGRATDPALARFLRSLAARDASPHTQRAYATAVGAYLDWLAARGTDWRTPVPGRPARLPRRARRGPRPLVGRAAAGRDPGLPSLGDPERPRPGRPVGRDRHAAPAAPPAAGPRGRAGRRGCSPSSRRTSTTRPGDDPRPGRRSGLALALRDRALVETAYAAGLRISELAAAELGVARPAARRDPGPGQGPQGADRPARPAGPRRARRRISRTAGRSCSSAAHGAEAPPVEIFLNHLGGPLGVRGLRYRLDRLCARAGPAGRRLAAHAAPLVRDPPARRRRRPARRPGAARPREPGDDPDLHARLARSPPGRLSGGPPAGASRPGAVTAAGALARAGLIVSSAFLVSRVLGYVRLVVIAQRVRVRPSSTRSSPRSGSRT